MDWSHYKKSIYVSLGILAIIALFLTNSWVNSSHSQKLTYHNNLSDEKRKHEILTRMWESQQSSKIDNTGDFCTRYTFQNATKNFRKEILDRIKVNGEDVPSAICALSLSSVLKEVEKTRQLNFQFVTVTTDSKFVFSLDRSEFMSSNQTLIGPKQTLPPAHANHIFYESTHTETNWPSNAKVYTDDFNKFLNSADIPFYDPDALIISNGLSNTNKTLQELLKRFSPKVIYVEFNPVIPPPAAICFEEDTQVRYGCSLSGYSKLVRRFGYRLLQVQLWEAIYVRYDFASLFQQSPSSDDFFFWKKGYINQYLITNHGTEINKAYGGREYYNNQVKQLAKLSPFEIYSEVQESFPKENVEFDHTQLELASVNSKRFAYLVTLPTGSDKYLLEKSLKSSYSEIFYLKASPNWAGDRDSLFSKVKKFEEKELNGHKFKYLIFVDGDIKFSNSRFAKATDTVNPWRRFERFLLDYSPAVAAPENRDLASIDASKNNIYGSLFAMSVVYYYDPSVVAFHRDAADVLLPYTISTDGPGESADWKLSHLRMVYKSVVYFKENVLEFYEMLVYSVKHIPSLPENIISKALIDVTTGLPQRLTNTCIVNSLNISRSAKRMWGNPRPKPEWDYNTRTYSNLGECSLLLACNNWGITCAHCTLDCLGRGTVNHEVCDKCVCTVAFWTGERCEVCGANQAICDQKVPNSTFVENECDCKKITI